MAISTGEVDLYDGAALVDGNIVLPSLGAYAYFSPTAAVLEVGQEVSVEFDYVLDADGWMEWAVYSMSPTGGTTGSNMYDLNFGGEKETSGTLGFTMSPGINAGDDALVDGETRAAVLFTGCSITAIRVVARPVPTVWGLTALDPTPQSGVFYGDYYPAVCPVWDDVAFVAWSSQGYSGPVDFFEGRAVRWTEAGDPELGPVHVEPDTLGAYSSITHCLKAGPGRVFVTAGEVNHKNVLGWVLSVDETTLGVTVEETVQHPTGLPEKDPWVVVADTTDGCMAMFRDRSTYDKTLVRVTAEGSVSFAYPPPMSSGDDDASNNYWDETVAFADMGTYWVRFVVAQGNVTPRTVLVYEHEKDAGGFPAGNGVLRFSRAETAFLGVGSQWSADTVWVAVVGTTIHVMQQASDLRRLRVHVLDTSTWSIMDEGHEVGNAWGSSSGNHQDDQMSLHPMFDRPGYSILGWNMRHPNGTQRSKLMVGTFDGVKSMDTAVCVSQVVGDGGLNTEGWAIAKGWQICYLGAGKFIGVAQSDYTDTVSTHAASVCGLIVWEQPTISDYLGSRRRFKR